MPLAPLTILLGKNNSGKSTVARLVQQVLTALASDGPDPFPMSGPRGFYGRSFRDIQHGGNFFNPLDLDIAFTSRARSSNELVAQIVQESDVAEDGPPLLRRSDLNGKGIPEGTAVRGLLPDIPESESVRIEAQKLLDASCYMRPLRPTVQASYSIQPKSKRLTPEGDDAVAHMLYADSRLRAAVGLWTEENLDGWRVDVNQSLEVFQVVARRAGREVNISDSGQGLQQVLPVVVLCCWRRLRGEVDEFIDVIEQPELHLHDAAQAPLGDLLLSAVNKTKGKVIVETHSEALVLRVRRRVAEGLPPGQVSILFVEDLKDHSAIRRINLDESGEVDWWPDGVFSEAFMEVKAIRRSQRRRSST